VSLLATQLCRCSFVRTVSNNGPKRSIDDTDSESKLEPACLNGLYVAMGDYSVHHHECVNHDRHYHRRRPPNDLEFSDRPKRTLAVVTDDDCGRTALTYDCGELGTVRGDELGGSYDASKDVFSAGNSGRTKVRRAATVDHVEHRRKRKHQPPATGSSASTPQHEYDPPFESAAVSDFSAAVTFGDVTAVDSVSSRTGDIADSVQRRADDNDWCECSSCHCQDKASHQTSADSDVNSVTNRGGNNGIRSGCKRCTGCAVVDRKCLSSTSFGSPVVCLAPTEVVSTGQQHAVASGPSLVSSEVQKVRLKVVYYHNRFVAVPVNSPPLPPPSTSRTDMHSASSAVTSSTSDPNQAAAAAAGCLPTSVEVPIIIPSCSSLSGTAADIATDQQSVSFDLRPLPNSSQDVAVSAVGGMDASKNLRKQHQRRRQQQQPTTMLRRIIKCLEDRDANAGDDDDDDVDGTSVKSSNGDKRRRRRRRRRRDNDGNRSAAFEAFVKTINVCFLMTGIFLLLGVVAVIVYTSIGKTCRYFCHSKNK
jgi:hypothetical protein